jgi:hypothetical protein
VRGYAINSEDEIYSTSADEGSEVDKPPQPCFSDAEQDGDDRETFTYTEIVNVSTPTHSRSTTRSLTAWFFAPSILPSHTLTHPSTSTQATLPEYTESGPGPSSLSPRDSLPEYADKITSEPEYEVQDGKAMGELGKVKMEEEKEKEEKEEMACDTETKSEMNVAEKVLASFTSYESLKRARLDSEYERVFERLQEEWRYVGGLVGVLSLIHISVRFCL